VPPATPSPEVSYAVYFNQRTNIDMPGLTGIISPHQSLASPSVVDGMVDAMRHESFYRTGTVHHERAGVAAGWALHAGLFADANPIWNAAGNVCLLLAGEEFSDPSSIASLQGRGQRSVEDGHYLVQWYEAVGPAFLDELNGSFSGLLVDLRQDLVMLFNDRFGLGRIYLHEGADALFFSSEAKSILRPVPSTRRIDDQALAEFVTCGCALHGRTLFAGISLLPPASRWIFSRGRLVRKETYFDIRSFEDLPSLGESEFRDRLQEQFPQVVRRYFKGSAPIGMSLTGGLDGRMIMACSGHDAGALPCYTFGGSYRDCTDVSLARRVAEACGQPHQVIAVDDAFIRQFSTLAEKAVYVSDGAMDVTGSVELFVNARAREIASVRMTGNYGSEILRSNVAFKAEPMEAGLFSADFMRLGAHACATYAREAAIRRLSLITMKQVPWHHCSRLSVEQSQLTMRSPYLDNDLVRLAYQAPQGGETSKTPALRFVADNSLQLAAIPTDRGLLHRPTPALTALGNLYQEFMFKAEYAYDYGMPQWLAPIDNVLKPLRPERLFLGRHKFYHFRVWYRDRLAAYLQDVLLDPRTSQRPHLAEGRLKTLVGEHLAGTHNHTTALHQALSIELIHRQLVERKW
jgi:asparagine synthase (glutamine-hydrolysing)